MMAFCKAKRFAALVLILFVNFSLVFIHFPTRVATRPEIAGFFTDFSNENLAKICSGCFAG